MTGQANNKLNTSLVGVVLCPALTHSEVTTHNLTNRESDTLISCTVVFLQTNSFFQSPFHCPMLIVIAYLVNRDGHCGGILL